MKILVLCFMKRRGYIGRHMAKVPNDIVPLNGKLFSAKITQRNFVQMGFIAQIFIILAPVKMSGRIKLFKAYL